MISGPIRRIQSTGTLRIHVYLLVVSLSPKSEPIFPIFTVFTLHRESAPTIIRSFGDRDRPIQPAESTGALRIHISVLAVVLSPKSAPIFAIFDVFFPPWPKHPHLHLERRLGGIDRRTRRGESIGALRIHISLFFVALSSKSAPIFPIFDVFFPPIPKLAQLQLERRLGDIDRPIQRAESIGALRIHISVLAVVLSPKSAPIFAIFDLFFPPWPKHPQLQLERRLGGIDRRTRRDESTDALRIHLSLLVVALSSKSAPIFPIFILFSPPLPKFPQLQLEHRLGI
jgi:hypothetical protein